MGEMYTEAILANEIPRMRLEAISRPRPYPWDVRVDLTLTDGGAADTFPVAYTLLLPATTYDFGDAPNRVIIRALILESISANDVYCAEFTKSPDGAAFTHIGALRFRRLNPSTRSLAIWAPIRPFNIDVMGLYGRLKSATGAGNSVIFSLSVARWFPPATTIPLSTGVWPYG